MTLEHNFMNYYETSHILNALRNDFLVSGILRRLDLAHIHRAQQPCFPEFPILSTDRQNTTARVAHCNISPTCTH